MSFLFTDTDDRRSCCRARTAECMACSFGQSVQQYCQSNPQTPGCQSNKFWLTVLHYKFKELIDRDEIV